MTVITSETAAEFYQSRLPQEAEKPPVDETPKADDKQNEVEGKEKPKKPLQPRINELVAERNQARDKAELAEANAAELRKELDEIRAQLQVMNASAPLESNPRPKREAFQSEDDFSEALSDWKADQRLFEKEKRDAEARQQALRAQAVEGWKSALDEVRARLTDYDTVVGESEINLPGHLYDAIVESRNPELAYHLAQHPDEARRLMAMSHNASLLALGKLETRIGSKQTGQTLPEVSKAPKPIEPVKGSSSPVEKDPKKMSYQEWKAAREAGQIR